MHIVCPHCTTSFAVDPRAISADGRTVRCARCKGTWFALPADLREEPALAAAAAGEVMAAPPRVGEPPPAAALPDGGENGEIPTVESPPLAGAPPAIDDTLAPPQILDAAAVPAPAVPETARPARKPRVRRGRKQGKRGVRSLTPRRVMAWPAACLATGLALVSLLVWRVDVVRLLPQTAPLFRAIGLDVNLHGLALRDVRTVRDTVDGKPVLIVEGAVESVAREAVDVPRLRLAVRDGRDAELYAWTAALEQTRLEPGGRARFRARLAEPPAEGRRVEVRFVARHHPGA